MSKKEKTIEEQAAEFLANENKAYEERMKLAARTDREAAAEAAKETKPAEGEGKG